MYRPLACCPACSRHVLTTEVTCPFCKVALPDQERSALPAPPRGLSRAAAIAFGATLAVTGCNDSTGPDDNGSIVAEYGASPVDSGSVDSGSAPDDAGSPVAEYGASPVDDAGGGVPKYGGPPVDAG